MGQLTKLIEKKYKVGDYAYIVLPGVEDGLSRGVPFPSTNTSYSKFLEINGDKAVVAPSWDLKHKITIDLNNTLVRSQEEEERIGNLEHADYILIRSKEEVPYRSREFRRRGTGNTVIDRIATQEFCDRYHLTRKEILEMPEEKLIELIQKDYGIKIDYIDKPPSDEPIRENGSGNIPKDKIKKGPPMGIGESALKIRKDVSKIFEDKTVATFEEQKY